MMRAFLLLLCVGLLPAVSFGQSGQAAEAPKDSEEAKELARDEPDPADSPLVRAAKEARARNRNAPSRTVLTNDDARKAKGTLILITEKPIDMGTVTRPKYPPRQPVQTGPTAEELAGVNAKLESARKEVSDLEKELSRLEEDYYNEDDPNYRDEVIEARFQQATKQLAVARQKLLDAREQQQKIEQIQTGKRPAN